MAIVQAPKNIQTPNRNPKSPRKGSGLTLTVIAIAQLMIILDVTVVNVALPTIQRDLNFSSVNLEWVVNGYAVTFGGLLLLGGRAGDIFGRRLLFMIGIGIFTVASLLGGLATSDTWLIITRIIQGIGAAIVAPTALSLLTENSPEGPDRNRAFGVYGAIAGAGGALGLLLGGILTDLASWRWVFFINIFIGAAVLILIPRVIGESVDKCKTLDLLGGLTVTAGMMSLVYGLTRAATYHFSDSLTILFLTLAVILLSIFVIIEARNPNGLMPLGIFSYRTRSGAFAVALAIGAALFAVFFFLTLFVQNILGYSPLKAGLGFLPLSIAISAVAALISRYISKIGVRLPMIVGTLLAAGGLLWMSRLTPTSGYVDIVLGPSLVLAVGLGLIFVPMTLSGVSKIRPGDAGLASALLNSGQQIGGSLGLAILVNVAISVTQSQIGVDQATAVTRGYSLAFIVAAGIAFVAFLISLFMIRNPRAGEPAIIENTPEASVDQDKCYSK